MVRSAWLRRAGPGVVAVVAIGLLTSTTLGARDRPWDPPGCAGQASLGDIPDRAARSAPIARPGDAPWFRLDPVLDASGTLTGQRLVIGRADGGGERSLDLAPESFAAGPFGAIVLAGTDDGSGSRLVALDVLAGCATTLDTATDVIRRATISPDGLAVMEFRVDRRSRADLGVWRKPLDPDAPASRAIAPLAADARFGRTWSTEFLWTVDATALAIQSCGETACRTRLFDPETGAQHLVDEPDLGPAVGLADRRLVAYLACRGLPCPIVAVDLSTGRRRTLAPDAGPAVVIATSDGPRLVHERSSGEQSAIRSVTLDGREGRDIGVLPAGFGLQVEESRASAAFDAPPGWILLAPEGRMPIDRAAPAAILRHVLDGRSAAVDEVTR